MRAVGVLGGRQRIRGLRWTAGGRQGRRAEGIIISRHLAGPCWSPAPLRPASYTSTGTAGASTGTAGEHRPGTGYRIRRDTSSDAGSERVVPWTVPRGVLDAAPEVGEGVVAGRL
jgi:hypothetical protein